MATSSSSSNSWLLSLKILITSVAVVSVAVTMKLTVPLMLNSLPSIWSVIVTWLKPPYLYVVINGIIITIAASTRFQHNQSYQQVDYPTPDAPPSSDLRSGLPSISNPSSFGVAELPPVTYDIERTVTVEPPVVYESKLPDLDSVAVSGSEAVDANESEFVTSQSRQSEFNLPWKEKQLLTSRFAHNRKPEGSRPLRVLKPKKHETLETTWKMITDGRQLPLTRHLRKSDTFDNRQHEAPSEESVATAAAKTKVVRKSETFKDRTTYANQNDYPEPSPENLSPTPGTKLKKDVSLGQDELNRRVEAFIKKFNDDMRLQRQESLKHYMEMVKSGAR